MEWRNELLAGITSIPRMGTPGRIIVFGGQAEAILTGSNEEDIVIAAAQYGCGRVVVFSHDSYRVGPHLSEATPPVVDDSLSTLYSNVRRWVTRGGATGDNTEYIKLSETRHGEEALLTAKIAVWAGGSAGRIGSARLLEYIENGGGFVHAMTPWGWLQRNSGKSMSQMPFWDVLTAAGVCYTDEYLASPAHVLVEKNKAAGSNLFRFLRENATTLTTLLDKSGLLKMLNFLPSDVLDSDEMKSLIALLFQMVSSHVVGVCPSPSTPTTTLEQAAVLHLWKSCVDVQKLTGIKAPGCNIFPGDFVDTPVLQTTTVEFTSEREDIHSTGLYCPAGQIIEVEVVSGNVGGAWKLIVGAHKDILKGEKLRRWPNIHKTQTLSESCYRFSSPFGGLLYLHSPKNVTSSIKVTFSNVVEAPQFILGDEESCPAAVSVWTTRRSAPGLWADIIGRHVMITLPSTSVKDIEDPTEAVLVWDHVIRMFHELRGTDASQHRRQWIVTDEQPSAGYMHSGYPIVTHLDVSRPDHKEFMLNDDKLREKGFWGMFHEIGHNMQRSDWTFEGTSEVTTNIFTLHAMDALSGQRPWIHSWLKGKLPDAIKYLNNGADFTKWKSSPDIALFVYAQLARDFGWDSYRAVFRRYEAMRAEQKPVNNQNKIDEWFRQFSGVVCHNLAPLAQFWGIPLTADALGPMAQFPAFLPDDETTQGAADRTSSIVLEFPGVVRSP